VFDDGTTRGTTPIRYRDRHLDQAQFLWLAWSLTGGAPCRWFDMGYRFHTVLLVFGLIKLIVYIYRSGMPDRQKTVGLIRADPG
jgi:hypothetical protein